jgi:hypothetical protein
LETIVKCLLWIIASDRVFGVLATIISGRLFGDRWIIIQVKLLDITFEFTAIMAVAAEDDDTIAGNFTGITISFKDTWSNQSAVDIELDDTVTIWLGLDRPGDTVPAAIGKVDIPTWVIGITGGWPIINIEERRIWVNLDSNLLHTIMIKEGQQIHSVVSTMTLFHFQSGQKWKVSGEGAVFENMGRGLLDLSLLPDIISQSSRTVIWLFRAKTRLGWFYSRCMSMWINI